MDLLASVLAYVTAAVTLGALLWPLVRPTGKPRRTVRRATGAGVVSRRPPRYGWGRLTSALVAAPLAALALSVACPALVPASSPGRYLAAIVLVVPLAALAPCLALAARSGLRAWAGAALTFATSAVVVWSALP